MKDRLRRWLWEPLLTQLRQGLSPERLAWTVAVGLALGVYPVLGVTTFLCLGAAHAARLNQPVIHLVNQAAYPLQLLLLVPFMKVGRLDRAMVTSAWAGAEEADAVLLIVDAADLTANASSPGARDTMAILEGLKDNRTKKKALVLNKIDGMKRTDLLPLVEKFHAEGIFEDVFLVSALKGEGVGDVASWVAARMPESPWLYPEDQAADIPSRLLAAEVTREKIYLRLHDELPYSSAVETEKWEERKDGSVKIDQIIYVQREGQKAIVLGKGGQTIKIIGGLAREELETLFGRRVHLFLFVKVREDWAENSEHYKEIGLDFPHDK